MDGGSIPWGFLCHLEARLMLTPSTQPSIRDTVCLENVEMKLTFKLREQRDTVFTKAGQAARISALFFGFL